MTKPERPPGEDEELADFETQLVVAWPGPQDPPPRPVRLPGLRIAAWPQADGSVLYEVRYRGQPYQATAKRSGHRDTVQMTVPWVKGPKEE